MLSEQVIRASLRAGWAIDDVDALVPQSEAMNSHVWSIQRLDGQRLIVKAAPHEQPLAAGLEIARAVEEAGITTGAAHPSQTGELTVAVDGWELAVLSFVPGRPLDTGSASDAELWGDALGELHQVLIELPVPDGADRWPWGWPAASDGHLIPLPDVRAAVEKSVSAARRAVEQHQLTMGLLHADPDASSFRVDSTGRVGIIDWGQATWGPLLYDVGSTVVLQILGRQDTYVDCFLRTYAAASPLPAYELDLLDIFVRLRWAVQAWWFAGRIADNDQRGVQGPRDNEAGLARAMQALR